MSVSRQLFDTFRSFNEPDISQSPEDRFLSYCREILSSVEKLHFDYKEKEDRRNAILGDRDKKNLAKAISGFANSNGGVLIWGLEDKKLAPRPIDNISRFSSNLLSQAVQCTDPPVSDIDIVFISANDTPSSAGYAILYIPESSLPPHRVILKNPEVRGRYYFRTGDSFIEATHTQLEDMFGRRPKPLLSLTSRIAVSSITDRRIVDLDIYIEITNSGRGVAKYPYLAVEFQSPHDVHNHGPIGLSQLPASPQEPMRAFGGGSDDVIHPGTTRYIFTIRVKSDTMESSGDIIDIKFSYQLSAEGILPLFDEFIVLGREIHRAIRRY